MKQSRIQALRTWMKSQGCLVHPGIEVPSMIEGVQGVSATTDLPHRTLIIAIPSKLIMTTQRCYKDPKLKRLFSKNDDLFDYQASEDAEFSVLCVFLMYHMLHLEQSPWREYLQCVAEPQTAIDWNGHQLMGLNRSMIEEIFHVKKECDLLQKDLIDYLLKRRQFKGAQRLQLQQLFNYCYRVVMTRSFGYYFSQSSLIPIADLINHKCEVVNHQLLNMQFERKEEEQEGYQLRSERIDCSLLGMDAPEQRKMPYRERFLLQKGLINEQYPLHELNRGKIDEMIDAWNVNLLKQGETVQNLQFCDEDDSQDNDTDQQNTFDKETELEMCRQNQQQQMEEFMKYKVSVERYEDVEKQLASLEGKQEVKKEKKQGNQEGSKGEKEEEGGEGEESKQESEEEESGQEEQIVEKQQKMQQGNNLPQVEEKAQKSGKKVQEKINQQKAGQEECPARNLNPFAREGVKGVPIQLVDSDSDDDSGGSEWGLEEGSYFTLSTSSAIKAGSEIYNSYGSRTNRFLLIWYGFCYRDNLYDSVSFRLQVQFGQGPRPAEQVVLDSYVGGQGRSFRKPNWQLVKASQISREFRLKRNKLNSRLLYFLRLYLLNYYKGEDLYKILVTYPASIQFELIVFKYYGEIVQALYKRYPQQTIDQLKKEIGDEQYRSIWHKINFKIIYLEEQRRILDRQVEGINALVTVLRQCQTNHNRLTADMYAEMPIQVVKFMKEYLSDIHKYHYYIEYNQSNQDNSPQPHTESTTPSHSENQT